MRYTFHDTTLCFVIPFDEALKKAGPYTGPRGEKWLDPKHTIPWKPEALPGKGKEPEEWGKLPPGKTAKEHAQIASAFLRKHKAALPGVKAAKTALVRFQKANPGELAYVYGPESH